MKRLLAIAALAILMIGSAFATEDSMVCAMTGETVESCCCVVTDGAMVCSMTGETVTTCCCSPAS